MTTRRLRGIAQPHLTAIVTLAINTGMRRGEILGLEWERIDLSTARITLVETKNGAPRGLPLNRAVYDALVALRRLQRHVGAWCSSARTAPPGARSARRSRRR